MTRTSILVTLLCLTVSWALPQAHSQSETTVKTKSTTVLVDATVHDGKGRPVRGLTAPDFEIYEDGVLQSVASIEELTADRLRSGDDHVSAEAPKTTGASNRPDVSPLNGGLRDSFVAIVTNSLQAGDTEGPHGAWVSAWDAIRDYSKDFMGARTHVGIFLIYLDLHRLKLIQFFTADKAGLLEAISRARIDPAAVQETPYSGPLAQAFKELARQFEAQTMTDAFLTLLHSMQILPGRKSILFLSREGIPLPPSILHRFWDVVHLADRLETAVYTVDASGLRIRSTAPGSELPRLTGPTAVSGSSSATLEGDGTGPLGPPLLRRVSENEEDKIRSDPHYNMNVLAEETGGLFIRDTNDLHAGLGRIRDHLDSYYLLAYTPKNPDFDGRFRSIEVRVKDPSLQVRYRRGYYAVDLAFDQPLLEYEAPALAVLEDGRSPHTLPVEGSALTFPRKGETDLTTVVAALGPGQISYRRTKDDLEESDFTIVALVKDAAGDIVRKVSQQYRLGRRPDGPTGGDGILFYRELALDPGRYMVEFAAFDALSGAAGTARTQLEVQAASPGLPGLSSVVIVDSAERAGRTTGSTPFRYGNVLFYPELDNQVSQARRSELTFYFSVLPREEPVPTAIVDLMQGGSIVHRNRIDLPDPDVDGRIQYAGSMPIGSYDKGVYLLRVTVLAGDKALSRTHPILLVP
ncbi:MAG: VWA domain-containing protein [Acidobacteriota bacterium]